MRALALPVLASTVLLGGCFTLRGSAGATVDSSGNFGATAGFETGLLTSLTDTSGVAYVLGAQGGYRAGDGLGVAPALGVDYVRKPDEGIHWRAGARGGFWAPLRDQEERARWQYGFAGALQPWSRTIGDSRGGSPNVRWGRTWSDLGIELRVLRESGGERGWQLTLALTAGITSLAQDDAHPLH